MNVEKLLFIKTVQFYILIKPIQNGYFNTVEWSKNVLYLSKFSS